VVFVFALDRQIVGEAIRHRYGGASTYTGENYLEKIFDFSVELPQVAGDAAKAFLDDLVQGIEPFRRALNAVVARVPAFANPRVIKRAVNRIRLFAALHEQKAGKQREAYDTLLSSQADVARFVCWVCGSERFRSFRRYLLEAPRDELDRFNDYVTMNETVALRQEALEIADSPGFGSYYMTLKDLSPNIQEQRNNDARYTLAFIDAWLRSVGL
jgi:hypothetical protein